MLSITVLRCMFAQMTLIKIHSGMACSSVHAPLRTKSKFIGQV